MIRLVVVDDHPVVRQGLIAMLRWEPELEIVGEAADGHDAVRQILDCRPDVVLLDLRLPGLSGVEVMREVRPRAPEVRFLVLTTYDSEIYIAPALAAGARGYLLKDATIDELMHGVRSVMAGRVALEPSVAERLLDHMTDTDSGGDLSERELEVLGLLVDGSSNRAIAQRLHLSENTVKAHISHIFTKLGAQSRTEAVTVALHRGLVSLK
jgi:DNA-binding NarL/FixJ family response regulator